MPNKKTKKKTEKYYLLAYDTNGRGLRLIDGYEHFIPETKIVPTLTECMDMYDIDAEQLKEFVIAEIIDTFNGEPISNLITRIHKDWETSLSSHKYIDIDDEYEEYRRLKNKFEYAEKIGVIATKRASGMHNRSNTTIPKEKGNK